VRLKSFCAVPEDIARYGPLWTEDGARSFSVTLSGPVKAGRKLGKLKDQFSKDDGASDDIEEWFDNVDDQEDKEKE